MKKVAVIMGSDSDLPVLKGAFEQLKKLGIPFEAHVYSAHRTPAEAAAFATFARESGFGVLIAAAGKAAHLAGALAAQTTLPVIGIPVKSSTLDGLDALLSTVQMPSGMPVATVAIDGAANAALLAAQILAVEDETLAEKLLAMRKAQRSFVCLTAKEVSTFMKKVAVIMGSDSDLPVLKGAFEQLKKLGIPFEAHVYSAHRTPAEAAAFATFARESGFGVLIAAAGKAAHLAGALAAQTTLPVIGIPVKSSTLDGLDALLSTVQMPSGMPVATVAIDGAANAALLAAQILAVEDETLAEKLLAMRKAQHDAVIAKDAALVIE